MIVPEHNPEEMKELADDFDRLEQENKNLKAELEQIKATDKFRVVANNIRLEAELEQANTQIEKLNKVTDRMKYLLVACHPSGCTDGGEAWYKEKASVFKALAELQESDDGR